MKNSLEILLNDLRSLKLYIEFQNESFRISSKFFKDNSIEKFKELQIAKLKRFNYNSYIISLYGLFERFIENIVLKYLETLSKIVSNYQSLPLAIKDINLTKNLEILSNLSHGRNKHIKPELIVKILNDNLNYDSTLLNNESFI